MAAPLGVLVPGRRNRWLELDGGQARTPDPDQDLSEDLEVRVRMAAEDWFHATTGQFVIGRTTVNQGWFVAAPLLFSTGRIALSVRVGGVLYNATSDLHGLDGHQLAHIRIYRHAGTGDVDFYLNTTDLALKPEDVTDWTAIGTDTTTPGPVDAPTAQPPFAAGLFPYDRDEDHGVHVLDEGHGGFKTADWLSANNEDLLADRVALFDPDYFLSPLMFNDQAHLPTVGVAPATAAANYQALIDKLREGKPGLPGAVVTLWTPDRSSTYPWSAYRDEQAAIVAADPDLDHIDFSDPATLDALTGLPWPQPGTPEGDASGYYDPDGVHPTTLGHAAIAAFFHAWAAALPDSHPWRAALLGCNSTPARLLAGPGDSITEGWYAATRLLRWQTVYADLERAAYMSDPGGGDGYHSFQWAGDVFPEPPRTGTVTQFIISGPGCRSVTLGASGTPGTTGTVTDTVEGTSVDLWYNAGSLSYLERNLEVLVDGVRHTVIDQYQATNEDKRLHIAFAVRGTHTVECRYADALLRVGANRGGSVPLAGRVHAVSVTAPVPDLLLDEDGSIHITEDGYAIELETA